MEVKKFPGNILIHLEVQLMMHCISFHLWILLDSLGSIFVLLIETIKA